MPSCSTSQEGDDGRASSAGGRRRQAITLLPLVAATYLMVSGGPFGLEDLISETGYARSIAILIVTPIAWSLPTALAVGELAATFPEEGGYYAWVRRALGPFWGVQEAWLSLAASFFDLAIYPTLFTRYLGRLWPAAESAPVALATGIALVAACTAMNLRGAKAAAGASVWLALALLCPFVVLALSAWIVPVRESTGGAPSSGGDLFAGLAVAMWNYMGWDNASTIATEVDQPARTYPRTMLLTVALVTLTYVIPVLAVAHTGIPPSAWTEGSWAQAGERIGGHPLAVAIAVAGMVSSAGMLAALILSYSRLPLALADDGYLPRWLARRSASTGAPAGALVACFVAYSACLSLGFKRLVELDVVLYGASLALEFVALAVLRITEPNIPRPFKVPGGLAGALLVGVLPMGLLAWTLTQGGDDGGGRPTVMLVAIGLVAIGPILYFARRK
jgi:amino acid transporter